MRDSYAHVKQTLKDYAEAIHEMAKVLLDVEVIEGCKVREIIEEFEKRHHLPSRLAHKEKVEQEQCDREERAKDRESASRKASAEAKVEPKSTEENGSAPESDNKDDEEARHS